MADLIRRARAALVDVTPGPWKEFIDDSGDQWTGWPLSIDATTIEDKAVVRTGGQWPYEWDTKTSQHEACANARFIAAARDLVPAMADRIEAQEALLREAAEVLGKLHHAVCGETGFAQCVRDDSKTLYPWPALDVADHAARPTLAKLRQHLEEQK